MVNDVRAISWLDAKLRVNFLRKSQWLAQLEPLPQPLVHHHTTLPLAHLYLHHSPAPSHVVPPPLVHRSKCARTTPVARSPHPSQPLCMRHRHSPSLTAQTTTACSSLPHYVCAYPLLGSPPPSRMSRANEHDYAILYLFKFK